MLGIRAVNLDDIGFLTVRRCRGVIAQIDPYGKEIVDGQVHLGIEAGQRVIGEQRAQVDHLEPVAGQTIGPARIDAVEYIKIAGQPGIRPGLQGGIGGAGVLVINERKDRARIQFHAVVIAGIGNRNADMVSTKGGDVGIALFINHAAQQRLDHGGQFLKIERGVQREQAGETGIIHDLHEIRIDRIGVLLHGGFGGIDDVEDLAFARFRVRGKRGRSFPERAVGDQVLDGFVAEELDDQNGWHAIGVFPPKPQVEEPVGQLDRGVGFPKGEQRRAV